MMQDKVTILMKEQGIALIKEDQRRTGLNEWTDGRSITSGTQQAVYARGFQLIF